MSCFNIFYWIQLNLDLDHKKDCNMNIAQIALFSQYCIASLLGLVNKAKINVLHSSHS